MRGFGNVLLGGRPGADPGNAGETASLGSLWECLGGAPDKQEEVAREREVWVFLLTLGISERK